MRQDASTVDVDLVANGNIVTQDTDVLQSCPFANGGVPADDGALDPGMILDFGSRQEDAALQAHAITDDNIWADSDVGADSAVLANLGRRVDQNITTVHIGRIRGRKKLGSLLCKGGEVEASS